MKFYLTTTLPYVNAAPHVGHALEFIQADVIARYKRQQLGQANVLFNVGVDEHGLKVYRKALSEGLSAQVYADRYALKWQEFCQKFFISFDSFYRTTDANHTERAQKFWKTCEKNGWIYKKRYKGLYCVGCEAFKIEKDLVEGKCPDHNEAPTILEEENYFFKLSAFSEQLLKVLREKKDFIVPREKQNELVEFIKSGLEDVSISRLKTNLPWGIPVPGDENQVFYVWFDALTNYVFAAGLYDDNEKFQDFWPAVQLCGPDNLRFQGALWQGMLAASGLAFSQRIIVHGTVLGADGRKMSKTIGNVVSPMDLHEKYGAEAVRFYFIAGVPAQDNFSFLEDRLIEIYNDRLADKFGNLLNRVLNLIKQKNIDLKIQTIEQNFKEQMEEYLNNFNKEMGSYQLDRAYNQISALTDFGNAYVNSEKPWDKNKDLKKVSAVLANLYYLLNEVARAYAPVIPESVARAQKMLENIETGVLFKKIDGEIKNIN